MRLVSFFALVGFVPYADAAVATVWGSKVHQELEHGHQRDSSLSKPSVGAAGGGSSSLFSCVVITLCGLPCGGEAIVPFALFPLVRYTQHATQPACRYLGNTCYLVAGPRISICLYMWHVTADRKDVRKDPT